MRKIGAFINETLLPGVLLNMFTSSMKHSALFIQYVHFFFLAEGSVNVKFKIKSTCFLSFARFLVKPF